MATKTFPCSLCNESFESRNKLFKHVRSCKPDVEGSVLKRQKIEDMTAVMSGYFLYVTGGRLRGKTLGSVERYNFQEAKWETCPSLLQNRGSHGAATVGDVLYVFGGGGFRSNLDTCESYHFGDTHWQSTAPMGTFRHALALVQASYPTSTSPAAPAVFAVGGWINGSVCSADLERYNVDTNTWTTCSSMSVPRRLLGAASRNNFLYVFGGHCDDGIWNTAAVECYDTALDRWIRLNDLPHAGPASAICVQNHVLLVFIQGKGVFEYQIDEAMVKEQFALHNSAVPASSEKTVVTTKTSSTTATVHAKKSTIESDTAVESNNKDVDADAATTTAVSNPTGRLMPLPRHQITGHGECRLLSSFPLPEWFGFDVTVKDDFVFVTGGATKGKWSQHFYCYHYSTNTWKQLPDMNTQRRRCAAAMMSVS